MGQGERVLFTKNMRRSKYSEINRDEVKYYFDILTNNSIDAIVKLTGYGRDFVYKTLETYKRNI